MAPRKTKRGEEPSSSKVAVTAPSRSVTRSMTTRTTRSSAAAASSASMASLPQQPQKKKLKKSPKEPANKKKKKDVEKEETKEEEEEAEEEEEKVPSDQDEGDGEVEHENLPPEEIKEGEQLSSVEKEQVLSDLEENDEKEQVPSDGVSSSKTIIIERCNQCTQFKKRATQVKEGLEAGVTGIKVLINPEKPRKGCFEIREEGGEVFITTMDTKRPFTNLKALDMDKVISDVIEKIK